MNALSNLVNSVVNAGQTAAKVASQTAEATVNAAATFINEKVEDIAEVGEAAAAGNLAGAGVELIEALSLGEVARDAATAVGLLPEDGGLLAEIVSAVGNLASTNVVAFGKDLADIAGEVGKASRPKVPPARGQTTEPPGDRLTHQGPGTGQASRHYPPGLSDRAPRDALRDFGATSGALADAIRDLVGSGALLPPPASGSPPIARPAPGDLKADIPQKVRDDLANNPLRTGGPVLGRPLSEVTYDEILADKTLSFEDLIFLFMSKMGLDMKKEIQDQLSEIAEMNKALEKKRTGEKEGKAPSKADGAAPGGGQSSAGSPIDAIMQGGVEGLVKTFLTPENIRAGLAGALDIAKVAAPIVLPIIGTAVGTIAPGVGNVIGGLAGGAGGAALGIGLDLLKGAVESGAFDGVIEGAIGLAGSAAGSGAGDVAPADRAKGPGATAAKSQAQAKATAGGSAKASEGNPELDKKTKDGIENDRDMALERLKLLQQRLSEMQQALSNILNAQHQTAMNTIGNIR